MVDKNINDILKEILDKKFQWSKVSGYDPADVDMFFDKIMVYLQKMNDELNQKNNEIVQNSIANSNLKQEIITLNTKITDLNKVIQEYQQEGYGNRHAHLKEIKTSRI